jgi:predicted N-acetyltransferase YhbS
MAWASPSSSGILIYPRFGFSAEKAELLRCRYSRPHFMALELVPDILVGVHGTVKYPPVFAEVD